MNDRHAGRSTRSQALRGLIAFLCVLLILFVGAAQVLHTHAADESANPGCSLCTVAHVSATVTPAVQSPILTKVAVDAPSAATPDSPARVVTFSLYVRPPPALTTRS